MGIGCFSLLDGKQVLGGGKTTQEIKARNIINFSNQEIKIGTE